MKRHCQKYKHIIASICQYVPRPTAIIFAGGGNEGNDNDHGDGDDDHGDGDDDHGDVDDDHGNVVGDYYDGTSKLKTHMFKLVYPP